MTNEKFDYFIARTEKDLDEIKAQLKLLITFRLMLVGAAVTVSTIFSVVTTLVVLFLKS